MAAKSESDWNSIVENYEELAVKNVIKRELANACIANGHRRPTVLQYRSFLASKTGTDLLLQWFDENEKRFSVATIGLERIEASGTECQAVIVTPCCSSANEVFNEVCSLGRELNIRFRVCSMESSLKGDIEALQSGLQFVIGTVGRVYDLMSIGAITVSSLKMFIAFNLEFEAFNDFIILLPNKVQRIWFNRDISRVPAKFKPIKIMETSNGFEYLAYEKNTTPLEDKQWVNSKPFCQDIDLLTGQTLFSNMSSPEKALSNDSSIVHIIRNSSRNGEVCEVPQPENDEVQLDNESPVVKDILKEILEIMQSNDEIDKNVKEEEGGSSSSSNPQVAVDEGIQKTSHCVEGNTNAIQSHSVKRKHKSKQKKPSRESIDVNAVKMFYLKVENKKLKLEYLRSLFKTLSVSNAVIYCNHSTAVTLNTVMQSAGVHVALLHEKMPYGERNRNTDLFRKSDKCVLLSTGRLGHKIELKPETLTITYDLPDTKEAFLERLLNKSKPVEILVALLAPEECTYFADLQKQLNFTAKEIKLDKNRK